MAKITVRIEIPGVTTQEIGEQAKDWFHEEDNLISIDESYLTTDPDDDSFYLFDCIKIED